MYMRGVCPICSKIMVFDCGDYSLGKVEQCLRRVDFGECKAGGFHVELGKLGDYVIVDWWHMYQTPEDARENNNPILIPNTETEWAEILPKKSQCFCVYVSDSLHICMYGKLFCRFYEKGGCVYRKVYGNRDWQRPMFDCLKEKAIKNYE